MVIEYDERNKTVKRVLESLISGGLIQRKNTSAKDKRIAEFKQALRESREIAADIAENGIEGYQTMDDFLKTL